TVLDFCRKRRDVTAFFRRSWIPDETFFQTLVRHLVPAAEIENGTLTFRKEEKQLYLSNLRNAMFVFKV
ncbi:MAG: hypothetical protein F6K39_29815, partial [Okeania sp. SIO3B3]|nr:hypothetical protein [Okeania sp. SIO3B3]